MSIKVGSVINGSVENITKFGAFIKLPTGKSGLLHISQVSDDYVRDINDYLKKNQEVKVKVISVDDTGERIGLTMRGIDSDAVIEVVASVVPEVSNRNNYGRRNDRDRDRTPKKPSFEDMLSNFMKESNDIQQQIKKNIEAKQRGGKKKLNTLKPSNQNQYED